MAAPGDDARSAGGRRSMAGDARCAVAGPRPDCSHIVHRPAGAKVRIALRSVRPSKHRRPSCGGIIRIRRPALVGQASPPRGWRPPRAFRPRTGPACPWGPAFAGTSTRVAHIPPSERHPSGGARAHVWPRSVERRSLVADRHPGDLQGDPGPMPGRPKPSPARGVMRSAPPIRPARVSPPIPSAVAPPDRRRPIVSCRRLSPPLASPSGTRSLDREAPFADPARSAEERVGSMIRTAQNADEKPLAGPPGVT